MPKHTVERHIAYPPDQLFALVADVERYPEFVPWWVAATVVKRDGDTYHTRQVIGLPLLRQEFQSQTILERPGKITVISSDRPFKSLHMCWQFEPSSRGGSDVRLAVDFEFRSARYSMLAGVISGEGIRRLVDAFEGRAVSMYGAPQHAPHVHSAVGGGHHSDPSGALLGGHGDAPHHGPARVVRRPERHIGLRPMAMSRPAVVSAGA